MQEKEIVQETREQSIEKIEFFISKLTDKQLRLTAAFMWGFLKAR